LLFCTKSGNFDPDFKCLPGVLTSLLPEYLRSHKRLVVPQLGAFIVKEPGHVLFSELLKRDDGVLRGLLTARGMNELESAGEIDRFVFEVRHAVERGAEYPVAGFGVMKPGPNGTIAFVCDPQAAVSPEAARAAGSADAAAAERTAPAASAPAAEKSAPYVSPSAKLNPEPCLKGLRYGKPQKNTDAYTYVDRPPRRRGMDRFLLIAIAAALIAAAAIGYGYYREAAEKRAEAAMVEELLQSLESAGVPEASETE